MNTVKENLIAAKALIDTPEKWGKEEYFDSLTGCMCAYGAVMAALGKDFSDPEVGDDVSPEDWALVEALPDGVTKDLCHVTLFNDADSTTHADIMALFQRAIDACPDP